MPKKNKKKKPFPFGKAFNIGGPEEDRTLGLSIANAALSQLSYRPIVSFFLNTADHI